MTAVDHRVDNFVANNKVYASSYQAPPSFAEIKAAGPPPHPAIVIISCCDMRLIPEDFFKFGRGEALVIRNGGGRAMDAIRTLCVLDQVLVVGTIIVVHHTDCGLTHATDEFVRKGLKERAPSHAEDINGMQFGEIKDLQESVKGDMKMLKDSPYFKSDLKVLGYIFDLEKGTLAEVTT